MPNLRVFKSFGLKHIKNKKNKNIIKWDVDTILENMASGNVRYWFIIVLVIKLVYYTGCLEQKVLYECLNIKHLKNQIKYNWINE